MKTRQDKKGIGVKNYLGVNGLSGHVRSGLVNQQDMSFASRRQHVWKMRVVATCGKCFSIKMKISLHAWSSLICGPF